jgi:GT2 family glycosyltransferase
MKNAAEKIRIAAVSGVTSEGPPAAGGGVLFVAFDRGSGALTITGTTRRYELVVDGRLVAIAALDESPLARERINRIADSNLEEMLPLWRLGHPGSTTFVERNFSPEWTLEDGGTAYLASQAGPAEQPVTAIFHCPVEGASLSIEAGEAYCFQAYLGFHRTSASLRMVFLDGAGRELDVRQAQCHSARMGGRKLSSYELAAVAATAPSNATHVRLEIVKGPTLGGKDSFLFFARPAFRRAAKPEGHDRLLNELPFELLANHFAAGGTALYHGEIPVPDEALDGAWHDVAVRHPVSHEERSVAFSIPAGLATALGPLELDKAALVSNFTPAEGFSGALSLSLWVDGQATPGKHQIGPAAGPLRIALPASACDGQPHVFELKLGQTGQSLASLAAMGPVSVTPWETLQKHAGAPLPGHLSPLAAYRYRSLCAEHRTAGGLTRAELHDILLEGSETPRRRFRALAFPAVESPDVSIVIPVHDKFDVTYVCLAALLFAVNRARFEVIVVDDGSGDTTLDLAAIAPGVTIVRNAKAQGFAAACNAGAARARAPHIVFLNNDTEVTAHWLDELLFVFRNNPAAGLAGSKLIYGNGKLQEAGGIVWETGDPWNYGRGGNAHEPRYSYTRLCDYVSGAAIMIDAALWKDVGGFSREFMPAYFEDTDLAYKVREAGRQVVFAPLSVVVHYEGLSNGADSEAASGLKRYQEINRPKFKRKWAARFEGAGKVGEAPDRAKDRGIRKRVLFIDYETPQIDRDAGSYAAIQEIRMFQALGAKVTFLPLNMAYMGRHSEYLQRLGVETIHQPFAGGFAAFIRERGSEFDAVYITRYGVAEHVLPQVKEHAPQAPVIINVADLHFLRQIRDALHANDPQRMAEALKTRDAETAVLARTDLILSYSAVEQAVITCHVTNGPKAGIVPWVVDPVSPERGFAERSGIAFLGGYRHYPNVDAVRFFAHEVMPILRGLLPDVPFLVYGSNVPPEIEALACDDIIIKGQVADVADIFDAARLMVAPLLTGAGVKGKVLDYIAHGLPSVLSPVAAEGIGLRHGDEALIAQTPSQWAKAIAALYDDEAQWSAMSGAALRFARSQYGFEKGVAGLSEALGLIDLHMTPGAPAFHVAAARAVAPTAARSADTTQHVPARDRR